MNKRFFQLRYIPTKQEYVIEPILKESKIDKSKLPDTVMQYDPYTWVCTNKLSLVEHVDVLKQKKIEELERKIKAVKNRTMIIN